MKREKKERQNSKIQCVIYYASKEVRHNNNARPSLFIGCLLMMCIIYINNNFVSFYTFFGFYINTVFIVVLK